MRMYIYNLSNISGGNFVTYLNLSMEGKVCLLFAMAGSLIKSDAFWFSTST